MRTDASGRVVDRAVRRYNLPGSTEAEARIHAECPPDLASCDLTLGWAHVRRLDPTSRRLYVGGSEVRLTDGSGVTVPLPRDRAAIVTLDVSFPDGRRASKALQVGRGTAARTEAAALAIPVVIPKEMTADELTERLRTAGHRLLAVENGLAEVVFVVDPSAVGPLRTMLRPTPVNLDKLTRVAHVDLQLDVRGETALRDFSSPVVTEYASPGPGRRLDPASLAALRHQAATWPILAAAQHLSALDRITTVVPSMNLARFVSHALDPRDADADGVAVDARAATEGWNWLARTFGGSESAADGGRRISDAVATGGLLAAGASRRRALVLVLGDAKGDTSVFSPSAARAYLEEIRVPLVVWRVGPSTSSEWPAGTAIQDVDGLSRALSALADLVESQRIVWLESEFFGGWSALPGLAGRR